MCIIVIAAADLVSEVQVDAFGVVVATLIYEVGRITGDTWGIVPIDQAIHTGEVRT
jgi:hypothetical protein